MQRKEASGTTTASRVKALLLHVQQHRGRVEADAFLKLTKLDREYLEDETRPVAIDTWHAAAVAFASRWGRDELRNITDSIIHPENLGVWTRVLRGTRSPLDAYRQFDAFGGEEQQTERWHTIREGPTSWCGRLPLLHDPSHERDGLLMLAREAELMAVPVLFGFAKAQLREVRLSLDESTGVELVVEVNWREPRADIPIALGAGLGATAGCLPGATLQDWMVLGLGSIVGGVGGAIAGRATMHEARRRAAGRAQMLRIQALERSAALREARERGNLGFQEGSVVAGQYRLGQQLGVGASGAIFEAVRLADGARVAIKLLRTPVAHDTVAADRLRREAAALGLAWHPNVVEVYDDGHLPDGTSYLVMERLYGDTLAERLRKVGHMDSGQVLSLAVQICDALEAVHAAGVIHRDLKPSNIFLSKDPDEAGSERVKVLDFGVARIEWAETRITNIGVPLGTPGYMSPEQQEGAEIDARSDLFALGGVIFECLTGMPPPTDGSDRWQVERDHAESPSGVQRAAQSIPPQWRVFIDRAMAKKPSDRFTDARATKEALLELTAGEPSSSASGAT